MEPCVADPTWELSQDPAGSLAFKADPGAKGPGEPCSVPPGPVTDPSEIGQMLLRLT